MNYGLTTSPEAFRDTFDFAEARRKEKQRLRLGSPYLFGRSAHGGGLRYIRAREALSLPTRVSFVESRERERERGRE